MVGNKRGLKTAQGRPVIVGDPFDVLRAFDKGLRVSTACRKWAIGTHENLVVNHAVRTGTSRKTYRTGIRWYELRNPNGAVTVHQQGTYAPDTTNYRWMGSAAMDKVGNLAVGYSISSTTLKPSIRFAARAASDPLGTLSSEANVFTGTGSQLQGLSRWGDYATISVDPADDCTMWFTTEYLANDGTFNWHTRVTNFKLQGCQ